MIAVLSALGFTLLALGLTGFVSYRRARSMVTDVQGIVAELEPQVATLMANAERASMHAERLSQGQAPEAQADEATHRGADAGGETPSAGASGAT